MADTKNRTVTTESLLWNEGEGPFKGSSLIAANSSTPVELLYDPQSWLGRVDWRFTTEDARIKLKRLYPSQDV